MENQRSADGQRPRRARGRFRSLVLAGTIALTAAATGREDAMTQPQDPRLSRKRTLDTAMSFPGPDSRDAWLQRKDWIRDRVLASCGFLPAPFEGPVEADVYDRREFDGFTVEKVLLWICDGYCATGNLYRPMGTRPGTRVPAVLSPHGHWAHGRFEHGEGGSVPARGITFARLGMVCFTYDMVGYGDSAKVLPDHGFGGPRETLWGISPAGLQLWTSIRALDFVSALPDVDPDRIGCTGASGGGTQTFLLYAVDDRVRVAAPVNMISHSMQGGCKCENPPLLRVQTDNMEIGATMAPRPLLMVAATGDWTRTTPRIEFPAVKRVYDLFSAGDRVAWHQEDAEHNYNLASRNAVYPWFGRWFFPERPSTDFAEAPGLSLPPPEALSVFASREVPDRVRDPEALFAGLRERWEQELWQAVAEGEGVFRDRYQTAFRLMLAFDTPDSESLDEEPLIPPQSRTDGLRHRRLLIVDRGTGVRCEADLWEPVSDTGGATPVLLVHPDGGRGLLDSDGRPGPLLAAHLASGSEVLCPTLFGTGAQADDPLYNQRTDGIQYFETYNLPTAACRVQDLLLAEAFLARRTATRIQVVALGRTAGAAVLALGALTHTQRLRADLGSLDFQDDRAFLADLPIPSVRRVGDLVTAVLLSTADEIEVSNCTDPGMAGRIQRALDTRTRWRQRR